MFQWLEATYETHSWHPRSAGSSHIGWNSDYPVARATPSSVTQSGAQALAVMTAEKTPASPFFESPLPTPSPTVVVVVPTAAISPVPTSSPVLPPTGLPISPLPSATATPAPGEWREFTDPEAGYTINFPTNAPISAGKSPGEVYQAVLVTFRLENVDKYHYQGMSLRVWPSKEKLSIDEVVKELFKDMTLKDLPENIDLNSQMEVTVIATLPAFQTDVLPGSTSVHVLIPHKDKVYIFALVHELAGIASDPQAVKLFYEILDSFRVLETP